MPNLYEVIHVYIYEDSEHTEVVAESEQEAMAVVEAAKAVEPWPWEARGVRVPPPQSPTAPASPPHLLLSLSFAPGAGLWPALITRTGAAFSA